MRLLLTLCVVVCLAVVVSGVEYVHTPLGRMRSDCVHRVASGSTLKENKEGRLDVLDSTGAYQRTLPKCAGQSVHPLFEPHSALRGPLRAYQRQAQRAKTILHEDEALKTKKQDDPPVFPPDYDGWEAYTAWNTSTGIDTFLGNFTVPDAPQNSPDILYIFTGLQNIDWIPMRDPNPDGFDIIQPVLQYPADSGVGWSIKSWYVTLDDGAIQSDELPIASGDNCFGNMTQTGPTSWYIGSTVSSTGQVTVTNVDRPRLAQQPWAYNTLECYGCVDCTTYPQQPSYFSELILAKDGEQLTPEWRLNPKPNPSLKCHETIADIEPDSQRIVFQ